MPDKTRSNSAKKTGFFILRFLSTACLHFGRIFPGCANFRAGMYAKGGTANNKYAGKSGDTNFRRWVSMKTNDNKAQQQKKAREQKGSLAKGDKKLNGPDRPST
ncbi:hypothetical protein UZ35_00380 [Heyndrickxia coagulans]|jgi:hypothetical protein|uniref:Uncharacterized protein n=3 Tax=Heyndrickxia TaxID=2837504 RepID=A0A0C5C839_HEYCO|nr:hypothetical protein SB48_HM08orf03220 [Heyndrickxia coagulans]APB36263.1 hypothetical protein BIZ35_05135 [Heyndrickxia coagulans]KWZ84327.1 hypothetical protein HMPREF3213_00849 [Heyndrickxia coagulans]KXT22058.1 hypothetical protein UZ35_00380 [Heyndrickxia coagulans]KYC61187.1 hypothetical protein B4100_3287 [Heyndrickxia coagulans]